jgi:hypothetical protein
MSPFASYKMGWSDGLYAFANRKATEFMQ